MKRITWFLMAMAFAVAVFPTRTHAGALPPDTVRLAPDLLVYEVRPGHWIHQSTIDQPGWGMVPSNGLLVVGEQGSLLLDTPWNDHQTLLLMNWSRDVLGKPVKYLIVTHAHEDRIGGIKSAKQAGVVTYALELTRSLAGRAGKERPDKDIEKDGILRLGEHRVEVLFPGHGHAPDNLLVYLPDSGVLYAACFVKGAGSTSIGNTADADLDTWRTGIQKTRARFPDTDLIIPGHGGVGGKELLDLTERLLDGALSAEGN